MDFLTLPRRDLQALCKRNGVRANMTNAAMAAALRALPKIDGIEEYVKQPVPVPEPEVKAVEEEQNVGRQGSPLPRGRRVVAKSSEPIDPEDAQALGVGRRGASRRSKPVPVVLQPAAEAEEDLKRETKRDHVPAPIVDRRGAGRRARPSLAVAAPEVAGAEEEQSEEVAEGEASMDDVPALGVGRRCAKRRIRPASSIAALADMLVAEEEQRALIPRGRRVKAKGSSSDPNRLDGIDDQEKEEAQILVGRRGGSSRGQAAPAVTAPETKAEEEQKERGDVLAIGVGRRGASKRAPSPLDDPATRGSAAASKAEAGDVSMEAVPIRATRQRKLTMKAAETAAAAAEKKAPRRGTRRDAVIQEKPQEAVGAPDVAVEVVPIRATRQRKLTMKAAAAAATAVEKVAPRVTRRGAVMRTLSQLEEQEAVVAPVSYQRCDALEELEEASDPQKEESNEDEAEDVVTIEDKKLIEETLAEESFVEEASDPQKEELNEDEAEDVVIIEDEKLMEETLAEESFVTDHECTDKSEMQEQQVDDEKCHAILAIREESPILGLVSMITEQASEDNRSANFQDGGGSSSGLLDNGVCYETYKSGEEMDLVPGVPALQAPLTANESDANHESEMGSVREKISEVDTKDDEVYKEKEHMDIAELQADIVDEEAFLHCSSNISQVAREEINNEDGLSCQEEGDVVVDKVLLDSVHTIILLDCSSDISWVEEKAGNITSEMPENQAALDEDGDKPNGVVIGDSMSQCTVTDEVVLEEKRVLITDEMPLEQVTDSQITVEVNTSLIVDERQKGTVTMDEEVVEDHSETDDVHSNEQIEVVTIDKVPELKLIEDVLVEADQVVVADNLPEQMADCEITVEENTALIVDEKQQSKVTMDEDADEQVEVEVPELTAANIEVIEEKMLVGVDGKQKITVRMDTDVVNDHFKTDVIADEQMEVEFTETDDEVVEEMKTLLVVDEAQQSTVTNIGNNVDDHFKAHGAHSDEQKEVVATEVPEVTGTDGEIEKTPLLVDDKKQSTNTVDGAVLFDHLITITAHAGEQKEVLATVTEVPDVVTGTDDEEKTVVITEEMPNQGTVPNIIHTLQECLKENYFETDLGQKAISADIEPEVSRAQDGGAQKENALLDNVTESLSKSIITMKPSVCKNSDEKNIAEPMAVLEEKGVKAAIESEDLTKLSLGQLRAKLKEKLNAKKNKEAKKRVALARVDENVCRSHAKGQQQTCICNSNNPGMKLALNSDSMQLW